MHTHVWHCCPRPSRYRGHDPATHTPQGLLRKVRTYLATRTQQALQAPNKDRQLQQGGCPASAISSRPTEPINPNSTVYQRAINNQNGHMAAQSAKDGTQQQPALLCTACVMFSTRIHPHCITVCTQSTNKKKTYLSKLRNAPTRPAANGHTLTEPQDLRVAAPQLSIQTLPQSKQEVELALALADSNVDNCAAAAATRSSLHIWLQKPRPHETMTIYQTINHTMSIS